MAGIVKIDFRIGGEDAVLRAIKTITQATETAARAQVRGQRQIATEATKATKQRATNDNASAASAAALANAEVREAKRKEDRKTELARQGAKRRQEALGAAMAKDVEESRRAEKRKEDLARTSARRRQEALGAAMAKDVEATQRAERRKEELVRRSARRRQEALGTAMARDVDAAQKADAKKAQLARRAEEREAQKARSATRGFYADTGQGLARGFNRGVGVIASGAGLLTGAIGIGGIEAAVTSQMGLETAAAQLAADVRTGDGKFLDRGALIDDAQRTAKATGIKSEDVLAAMGDAASKGGGAEGLKAFRGGLSGWAELALASGTAIGDLASVSATMSNNGISDPKQQLEIARSINAAAKTGNVGFRDMAANMMEVAGMHQAMGFAGSSERRMGLASGLIQMAQAGGAASAAEAATSANSFMADLVGDKAKKLLTSKGIKTYTKDAQGNKVARDAEDLAVDLFKASKGDPEKLSKVFDIRSKKTQAEISKAWNKDGEAGIRALFKEFTQAKQSEKQVKEEADLQKGTTANQVARAMEDFKAKVGTDLLPTLTKLIPAFTRLAGIVAQLVKEFAEAPGVMIAKFLALSTLLGGAQAALGNVISRAGGALLDKLMGAKVMTMNVQAAAVNMASSASAALGGPLAGGGTAGLNAATAAHVVAAGAAGYMAGSALTSAADKDLTKENASRQNLGIQALSLSQDVGRDPKKLEQAKAMLAKLQGEKDKGALSRMYEGATGGLRGIANGDVSLGNILSLAPQVAVLRGVGNAVLGGKMASEDKTTDMGIAALTDAIARANQPGIAATEANTAAIQALPQQIAGAVNLQQPKAQP